LYDVIHSSLLQAGVTMPEMATGYWAGQEMLIRRCLWLLPKGEPSLGKGMAFVMHKPRGVTPVVSAPAPVKPWQRKTPD
jgi:hypothetical protein